MDAKKIAEKLIEDNTASIKELVEQIDKAKADLVQADLADGPKLRVGDFCTAKAIGYSTGIKWVVPCLPARWPYKTTFMANKYADYELTDIRTLGNYIDEIERNSEDLREFEVKDCDDSDKIQCELNRNGILEVWHCRNRQSVGFSRHVHLKPDKGGKELYQKLGQILAYVERMRH